MLAPLRSLVVQTLRSTGRALDRVGMMLEVNPYRETLQPSTRLVEYKKIKPSINACFVASSASIIGKVQIGSDSSVWYGAVIRGDVNTITIGNKVTVGDRVMVHCSGVLTNHPTKIGNNVVIGAGAIIHGCTIEDDCYIGSGAQVLDGAVVQKNGMVAAGSIVPSGKVVKSGQLWSGVPAVYTRDLSPQEISSISATANDNIEWATLHSKETAKTWEEIEQETYDYEQRVERNEYYYKRLTKEQVDFKLGNLTNSTSVPGRIFDGNASNRFGPVAQSRDEAL